MLLIGFAFFINPVPFGLDIIPDVIGCVLIFSGLTQLAYFDGSVEEARKSLLYLTAIELLHLIMMRSVFLTNISSNRMLAVTGFSIVQGILYIMLFKKLFGGISYYAMRRNCNKTLALCDGAAFMSYLAFFIRLGATLLPELIAILELRLSIEVEPDVYDAIASFVGMKPIIVVLVSAIALGTSAAWYFSIARLFRTFSAEAGEELDSRYFSEYSSRPEKTLPKKLRSATYVLYFALFFMIDFSLDGIRVIPASAMFPLLFIGAFCFKGLSDFTQTKKLAIPAFFLLFGTEIFTALLNPNGAVIIYETKFWIASIGAVYGIITAVVCMLCVRGFLSDVRTLSADLCLGEISTTVPWIAYCIAVTAWAVGFAIPYLLPYISAVRLIAAAVFIIQTVRVIGKINEMELERYSLYN